MAKEKEAKVAESFEPKFDKDQFLSTPKYHVGQRAFIEGMDDKDFPMSIKEMDKKLGGTK